MTNKEEEKLNMMHREDRDLLIQLDTKFNSMENQFSKLSNAIHEKFERIFLMLERKADRSDITSINGKINKIKKRINILEKKQNAGEVKKKTLIDVGNMGIKGWGLLIGAISFLIMLINWVQSF